MYELKNGILHCDGKPIIALGVSYYASFHKAKYPVPAEADRFAEMRKDIRRIKEAGFQQIRTAALGNITMDGNDHVMIDCPLIDAIVKEAAEAGLTTSIRLQGYVMNLHGYKDYIMRNQDDRPMGCGWADFLRSSLFHDGVMADNRLASRELAAHFADMPEMLSYQIYNEPHYPQDGIYDYHPLTVAAYRKWLAEKGLPEQDPPRRRPMTQNRAKAEEWVRWREFNNEALNRFMDDTAAATVQGAPHVATYTNMTSAIIGDTAGFLGVSYFDNAKSPMELVGITSYSQVEGGDAYQAMEQYALAESAAALHGKHAWNIEVDARTHMPARKLYQEVYAQLAAGLKGLNFYEWRGDYPDPESPNPDNCGFIFSDGSKTEHYDRSIEMIRFVNRYSTLFATAEKLREGVAILFSEHGILFADSLTGEHANLYTRNMQRAYRDLRRAGISPDFTEAENLKDNRFSVRVLFVPCEKDWLGEKERSALDAFVQNGGSVWYLCQKGTFDTFVSEGWWNWSVPRLNTTRTEFRGMSEVEDVLEQCGVTATVDVSDRHLFTGIQCGEGYSLVYLINTDPARKAVSGATMMVALPFEKAVFLSPQGEIPLNAENGRITLPDVDEGGVVLLR